MISYNVLVTKQIEKKMNNIIHVMKRKCVSFVDKVFVKCHLVAKQDNLFVICLRYCLTKLTLTMHVISPI